MIDRQGLLADLQAMVRLLEDDLRQRVDSDPELDAPLLAEWLRASTAGRTSETYESWRDAELTQVAVAWVLACAFIRFCEDNELVDVPLLSGPGDRRAVAQDHRTLWFREHPEKGDREWLAEVVARSAALPGLSAVLGAHNPLHRLGPSADGARALVELWWRIDPVSGDLVHDFRDPGWDTRFLGDLYQDLSEAARKRYALLQTPEFVEELILDRTLEPALDTFGLEGFRGIDPTCGSGHFLLGLFERVFRRWQDRAPGENPRVLAQRALDAVHGVDLNPFAVAISEFRLLVAALRASGTKRLAAAPDFRLHLASGDSLLHGTRPVRLFAESATAAQQQFYGAEDAEALAVLLEAGRYHVVVGNPPYVTVKDKAVSDEYKRLYDTCYRQYSLGVPFTERFPDLAVAGDAGQPAGFVGMITANSFMKREFGKKLIEDCLPRVDLTHVIDTSGAYIPGHGTPTVILLARNQTPATGAVRMVQGIRGEPSRPTDPAKGLVWTSIVDLLDQPGAQNDYVSVVDLDRARLDAHPWSIGGGGASELKDQLERNREATLATVRRLVGYTGQTNADDAMLVPADVAARQQLEAAFQRGMVIGEIIRDWRIHRGEQVFFPYDESSLRPIEEMPQWGRRLWPTRTTMWARATFSKQTYRHEGRTWWEWHQMALDRLRTPMSIAFAFVATHNHFVLDRGGKVFKQTAPVIKLPEWATEDEHLGLLGLLNSSTGCFWMKQVCQSKGNGGIGGGIGDEDWEPRFEFDATKLQRFPVPTGRPLELARRLDHLASERAGLLERERFAGGVFDAEGLTAAASEDARLFRELVGLQEELDWACYRLYGLVDDELTLPVDQLPQVQLGERAFEIVLARRVAAGDVTTEWFRRHGSTPVTEIPERWPEAYRALVQRRIDTIEANAAIGLIERPEYKRRWNVEPFESRKQSALRSWLLDRLEAPELWSSGRLTTIARLADALRGDEAFVSTARLYAGEEVDLTKLVGELVGEEAVPCLAAWRYKEPGLRKRAQWEATWELQRAEDAIDARTLLAEDDPRHVSVEQAERAKRDEVGAIPVPPKYGSGDFAKTTYWRLRGKLDVPKERFVSYPGAERENDPTLVVGWAGWDHLAQATALAGWYTETRDRGVDAERLVPLLAGLWELVPWLRQWHNDPDPATGERLGDFYATFVQTQCATLGVTTHDLTAWRPPAPTRGRKRKV